MTRPKKPTGYQIGIVNPLTLVGNEVKSILRERSFPFMRAVLLDSTGKSAGAVTEIGDEPAIVTAISDDELEDLDLAFFAGPASSNREWIERAHEDKFIAIDLSQPTSTEGGRLAVAGMNLDELVAGDNLIVSPHPVAVPIALIIHQIQTAVKVSSCTVSVVQPASEFEQAGIEELAAQTVSVLNVKSVRKNVFDRQLAFNLFPALERNEEFIVSQIREMTGPRLEVALFITQGTIFHSHTFSMFVRVPDAVDADRITALLRQKPAIAFAEGDQTFGTIDAAGRDEVLIAEVRNDPTVRGGIWIWAVCDNLRRSSALNAVLIAEKLLIDSVTN